MAMSWLCRAPVGLLFVHVSVENVDILVVVVDCHHRDDIGVHQILRLRGEPGLAEAARHLELPIKLSKMTNYNM